MARIVSPFARQARKRTTLATIRARAPKHPPGPEAQIRRALTAAFAAYHKGVKAHFLALARSRRDAAADDPGSQGILHSIYAAAAVAAHALLYQSPFRRLLAEAAKRTADSARKQTAAALKLGTSFDPDLDPATDTLSDRVFLGASELMQRSVERAEDVYDEWDALDPETSPRAGDVDALDGMLVDGLDGIAGTALAWAGLAFGDAFADMIKGSQQEAGVSQYQWCSQRDSKVRESHMALDGQIFGWDDPPLKPGQEPDGDPSIDEDSHPGEPPNCRCVASPVDDQDSLTDRQEERLPN